jgi:YVTN family beta-propeller protein
LAAILQPELTEQITEGAATSTVENDATNLLNLYSNIQEGSDEAKTFLLVVASHAGAQTINSDFAKSVLSPLQTSGIESSGMATAFGLLGSALSTYSLDQEINADVAQAMYLHLINAGQAYDRMTALQNFLTANNYYNDPAIQAGFAAAQSDAEATITTQFNNDVATLQAIWQHSGDVVVTIATWVPTLIDVTQASIPALQSGIEILGTFGGPEALQGLLDTASSYLVGAANFLGNIPEPTIQAIILLLENLQMLAQETNDINTLQALSAAATIEHDLYVYEQTMPGSSASSTDSADIREFYTVVQMRYGLGYWWSVHFENTNQDSGLLGILQDLVNYGEGTSGAAAGIESGLVSWEEILLGLTTSINRYLEQKECTFTVSATGPYSSSAQTGSATVTTNRICVWSVGASLGYPWLSVSGSKGATGSGSFGFSMSANTGSWRLGAIPILDSNSNVAQSLWVVQDASALPTVSSVGVSPSTIASGQSANVTITLSGPAPSDGAVVSLWAGSPGLNLPFQYVNPDGSDSFLVTIPGGQTSISFSAQACSGGQITVSASLTAYYNGSQASASATVNESNICCHALQPPTTRVLATEDAGAILVQTGATGTSCPWTATVASNAPWATIYTGSSGLGSSSASGTGTEALNYMVTPNATGSPRTAVITVGDQSVSVVQPSSAAANLNASLPGMTLSQGQQNVQASLNVINSGAASSGTITVGVVMPSGFQLVSLAGGSDWTCPGGGTICTTNTVIEPGSTASESPGPITVTFNVLSGASTPQVVQTYTAGGGSATYNDWSIFYIGPPQVLAPSLQVSVSPVGTYFQGENGAQMTLMVKNTGAGPTSGTVTLTEALPQGFQILTQGCGIGTLDANGDCPGNSENGSNAWACSVPDPGSGLPTCITYEALAPGASYAPVTVTFTIDPNALPSVTNQATVSGGGSPTETVNTPMTVQPPVAANTYVITTYAGTGIYGYSGDNGPATSAQLHVPGGIALDLSGNLYIADSGNNVVRMVSMSGTITTVAGNGSWGNTGDGQAATAATLAAPEGVAVDSSGNIYIADTSNSRVRVVSNGVIQPFAGTGTYGDSGDGNQAVKAELEYPWGLGIDSSGNVYIADQQDNKIREVTVANGLINTVAGTGMAQFSGDTGPALSADLNSPEGVALDSGGDVFIADTGNLRIRDVSSGQINTVAGNGSSSLDQGSGIAISNGVDYPTAVAVDVSGNLYVAQKDYGLVRMVAPNASTGQLWLTTIAGNGNPGYSGDNGPATAAELRNSQGIAVDKAGRVYVADTGNQCIRVLLPANVVPWLGITSSHTGSFFTGETGAQYTLTVSNGAAGGYTMGVVTVTESAPSGLSVVSMSGTGWNCAPSSGTCTRSDPLNVGSSYPPITVTVNVSSSAPSSLTNTASVSGGGSASASASDATTISSSGSVSYTISGLVALSGSGMNGVTVTLSGSCTGSTTTDGLGNYFFIVNAGGSYTVTPSLTNYTFSPPSATFSSLGGNQTANFTASVLTETTVVTAGFPLALGVNTVTNQIYVTGWVDNLGVDGGNVTVIDGATNNTVTVPVGNGPDSVAVNPVTNTIYVANNSPFTFSGSVSVIDGNTNTITATVSTGCSLSTVAVNPVTNQIYVTGYWSGCNILDVIDGATNTPTSLTAGSQPNRIAINQAANKIYIANAGDSTVTVIDGATNTTTIVPVGATPVDVAANSVTNKIYVVSQGNNTVTVIDGATNNTLPVPTGSQPFNIAVNPVTNKIYVSNAGDNTVTVIDGATNNTLTVPAGNQPRGVAVNTQTNQIYVANYGYGDNTVTLIDGATNATTSVPVAGNQPITLAVNPATNTIYVAAGGSNEHGHTDNVTVINGASITPALSFSPTGLAFGPQPVGSGSTSQTLTLTNTSTASLAVSSIVASGDFAQTNNCGSSLAAGGNCIISVTFTPTMYGNRTGWIMITDNASNSLQSFSLTGTGTTPVAGVSLSSLTFSNQVVGTTSASQPVTLSNMGTAALTIASIATSANFGETNNCAGSVAASGSCTINVTFSPTASGRLTGTLTITDNNNGVAGSTQTVTLSGTGVELFVHWPGPIVLPPRPPSHPVPLQPTGGLPPTPPVTEPISVPAPMPAPAAGLARSSLTFSAQNVGTRSNAQTVTLTNTGKGSLTISSIAASGDFSQTNTCRTTLSAGADCAISVTFRPVAAGTRTGTLSISDNATGNPQTIALNGTGLVFTVGPNPPVLQQHPVSPQPPN